MRSLFSVIKLGLVLTVTIGIMQAVVASQNHRQIHSPRIVKQIGALKP